MGKCLLHKETDASKVDPEVRAFVGKTWVCNFIDYYVLSILKKLADKEKQIEKDKQTKTNIKIDIIQNNRLTDIIVLQKY